jgi:hypothetical protein
MFANSGDQLLSINDQFSLAMDLGFQNKENRKNFLNLWIETLDTYKKTIQTVIFASNLHIFYWSICI